MEFKLARIMIEAIDHFLVALLEPFKIAPALLQLYELPNNLLNLSGTEDLFNDTIGNS